MSARFDSSAPAAPPRQPLWLCLHFDRLALDVFALHGDTRAIAVIEQRQIHCSNRDNLPAGIALATAQALHPALLALERQPERERDYLHQLAHWAYQFTPNVVIDQNNSLLLDIGSCLLLYRGARNLLRTIRQSLQQRQQHAHCGLARTPKAAWLLAQCGCQPALRGQRVDEALLQNQLAQIPVAALQIDIAARRALAQMGLTTLRALLDLPGAALGKRFGSAFIDYLQKIAGHSPDPQQFFTPAARFQHGLTFIDGVAQRQMLLFPMKRLLQMLDDYLRARQLHCHTLHWQLFDAHQLQGEFSVELSRTQTRWPDLLELSRLKLEQIERIAPVFSVHLSCENFFEAAPVARQLFADANDQREAALSLLDRLQARLGKEALQRIAVSDSHWPELAWRQTDAKTSLSAIMCSSTRPLWLLPKPQPLPQRDNQPLWPTPLTLLRGPERLGNHWWQEQACERDYYIARNDRHIVCWIYRERATQRWFLHGLFA